MKKEKFGTNSELACSWKTEKGKGLLLNISVKCYIC
jgi:hypothetical protein